MEPWAAWSGIRYGGWHPCLRQRGWSSMILEVPSSPSHSMILWILLREKFKAVCKVIFFSQKSSPKKAFVPKTFPKISISYQQGVKRKAFVSPGLVTTTVLSPSNTTRWVTKHQQFSIPRVEFSHSSAFENIYWKQLLKLYASTKQFVHIKSLCISSFCCCCLFFKYMNLHSD